MYNEDIILGKLRKNREQLENMSKYTTTPIATYTHTTNKEVVVSAVDVDTNTFTSAEHGLNNGDVIYPIMNSDAGNIYPLDKYAGGIGYVAHYVINKTDNTFQLSLTSGGSAVDLITNANMDLTKWHFERFSAEPNIINLPPLTKAKVQVCGRTLGTGLPAYVLPDAIPVATEWLTSIGTSYAYPTSGAYGDIYVFLETIISYKQFLTILHNGIAVRSATSATTIDTLINKSMVSPKYSGGTFNSVKFQSFMFANGTTVEVYKA